MLGYVLKQSAPAELLQAIRAAAAGEPYLDSTLAKRVTSGFLAREGRTNNAGRGPQRPGGRGPAPNCSRLQQQGNRSQALAQREDGRGPQGKRDAKARSERPHRHRQIRNFEGMAAQRLRSFGGHLGIFPTRPAFFPIALAVARGVESRREPDGSSSSTPRGGIREPLESPVTQRPPVAWRTTSSRLLDILGANLLFIGVNSAEPRSG